MSGVDTINPARAMYLVNSRGETLTELPVTSTQVTIGPVMVPGIGTAAAYADGDALGTKFQFTNVFRAPKYSGVIVSALYYDLDDEGLGVDLHLFKADFTSGTDNSAFAPSDADLLNWVGTISFGTSDFFNLGSNQVGQKLALGLGINGASSTLYCQAVARGALNIADVHNIPRFSIVVFQD